MFNQSNYRKRTRKISKARLNWYQLAKEQKELRRINQYQNSVNRRQNLLNEDFDERLRALELAQQQDNRSLWARLKGLFA